MNLKDLKNRCESKGFKYAYGLFKNEIQAPYLCAFSNESDAFHADDIVYFKKIRIDLVYTYENRDASEIETIENEILHDVTWEKSEEDYLENERVWQITYSFFIIGG